ncbi:riboflavin kinase [Leptospira alexanderi]|uniref:riboflavin kinase n=1 Tax=Leptospira alexanderi TaxID=100053 RepID=UPI003D1678A8
MFYQKFIPKTSKAFISTKELLLNEVNRIRDEIKFSGVENLISQLKEDEIESRKILKFKTSAR